MEITNNKRGLYSECMYAPKHCYTVDEIKKIMNKILTDNYEIFKVDKVYLFGSYARSEATSKSDIDFAIETTENMGIRFFGLYVLFEEAFNKSVDIVELDSENMNIDLKINIERDKVLIYER